VVDLVEDAYDLVIRINPSPDERLVGRSFLNDERLIVATPDVPRPCPTTEGEDVIVKFVLLGTRPAPAVWRMRSAAEKDIVLKPEPALRLSSLLMVLDAVLAGAGAALLPSFSSPTTSRRAGLHIGEPMPVHRWKSGRSKARAASAALRLASRQAAPWLRKISATTRAGRSTNAGCYFGGGL
jgi:DNA-binding transcriptional LysR family regulator